MIPVFEGLSPPQTVCSQKHFWSSDGEPSSLGHLVRRVYNVLPRLFVSLTSWFLCTSRGDASSLRHCFTVHAAAGGGLGPGIRPCPLCTQRSFYLKCLFPADPSSLPSALGKHFLFTGASLNLRQLSEPRMLLGTRSREHYGLPHRFQHAVRAESVLR